MYSVVIAIHVVICVAISVVVLLQQGKGADIGAVFGGSSQTVFGSGGAGNFLTRLTGALAVLFFVTSIFLAYSSTRRVTRSVFDRPVKVPAGAVPAPAQPPVPAQPKVPKAKK